MSTVTNEKMWIGRLHEYWGLVVGKTDPHPTEDAAFREVFNMRKEAITPLRKNPNWKFIKRSYVTTIQVEAKN